MNIFGTSKLLHVKLCNEPEIELCTSGSAMPKRAAVNKEVWEISEQQDHFDSSQDTTQAQDETPTKRETVIPGTNEVIKITADHSDDCFGNVAFPTKTVVCNKCLL
jgi:hypothetical protein